MTRSIFTASVGSGFKFATNNYTDGADSKHDEVMVLGEQFLPTYSLLTNGGPSTATANSHICQLMAGVSLKVRVRRIEIHQFQAATAAAVMLTHLYRLTTAGTGGTAVTPNALDTTSAAAGATGMTLPTVKGTEGAIIDFASPVMWQTVGASSSFPTPVVVWDFDKPHMQPLTIAAGATNGIAIKNVTAVAAGGVVVKIWFDESSY